MFAKNFLYKISDIYKKVQAEQNVLGKQTLSPKQEAVLKEEKDFLTDLVITLKEIGATKEDIDSVRRSIVQLEDLFLLVVVGEFNSGKRYTSFSTRYFLLTN